MTDTELDAIIGRSYAEFAAAEGQPDPISSFPLHAPPPSSPAGR
jgi:hypothetical protein